MITCRLTPIFFFSFCLNVPFCCCRAAICCLIITTYAVQLVPVSLVMLRTTTTSVSPFAVQVFFATHTVSAQSRHECERAATLGESD